MSLRTVYQFSEVQLESFTEFNQQSEVARYE